MWQCPVFKPERDSFTIHILLAHDSHDLSNIEIASFGACGHHAIDAIRVIHNILSLAGGSLEEFVEVFVDIGFETVEDAFAWLTVEFVVHGFLNFLVDDGVGLVELLDDLLLDLGTREDVRDSHAEAEVNEPVVHQLLSIGEKLSSLQRIVV